MPFAFALQRFVASALASLAIAAFTSAGNGIIRAGDVDKDGRPDFALTWKEPDVQVVGVDVSAVQRDQVWIVSGASARVIRILRPPRAAHDFGRRVINVGDLDADGADELAVPGAGVLWIYSGETGEVLHEIGGPLAGPGFPSQVAVGRDVDGDERPDIAIFRAAEETKEVKRSSLIALYSGATGQLLRVFTNDPRPVWNALLPAHLLHALPELQLTGAIELCADRDSDGRAELAIATSEVESALGPVDKLVIRHSVRVIDALSGFEFVQFPVYDCNEFAPPSWLTSISDIDGDGVAEIALTRITRHLAIHSGKSGEQLLLHSWPNMYDRGEGLTVEVLGDVNGDGAVDLVLGANDEEYWCADEGFAVIHCGKTTDYLGELYLSTAESSVPAAWQGKPTNWIVPGVDVCTLGDFDGDGVNDALVAIRRLNQLRILSGKGFKELKRFAISDIYELKAGAQPANPPTSASR